MKKGVFIFLFFLLSLNAKAQFTFYKPLPNLIVANEEKGAIDIGISYAFAFKQAKLVYNLSEQYFVFGTYNFDNSQSTYKKIAFFGSVPIIREKRNSGFSIGGGIQKLGRIGNNKNLEVIAGFEKQKIHNLESFTTSHSFSDEIIHEYYRIFTQFNMTKNRTNWDFGYSLKISFLKFIEYQYNSQDSNFKGKSIVILDPTFNIQYKMLPQKRLILSSQIGISAAINNLESRMIDGSGVKIESERIIRSIIKIGIAYRFAFLNNDADKKQ